MTQPITPIAPIAGTAPAGAPHETTQPLDVGARSVPAHLQGMEKTLAPLTYTDPALPGVVPTEPAATASAVRPVVPDSAPAGTLAAAAQGPQTTAPVVDPAAAHQPAASASESPARGLPTPARDPSLQPTGGFGPMPGVQYTPLDGTEVRELVLGLFDQIVTQIATDLRFQRALTYPRLECRVTVDVMTFPPESAVRITKILPDPPGQLPRDVAIQHADECCFVVSAKRQEMDAAGNPVDPPDKIRDELRLPKPHMQVVGTGAARQLVDVPATVAPERQHDVNGMPIVPGATLAAGLAMEPARQAVQGAGSVPRATPGVEGVTVPPIVGVG